MKTVTRVLYVEDNPQNRILVRRILDRAGWALQEAERAEEGLELLAAPKLPDLVLMDLALPGMDGYEATRRIKADPRLARIPVVALTAHAMPGDKERALGAGCDGYLTKPIQVETFLDALRDFVAPSAAGDAALDGLPALLEAAASTGEFDPEALDVARRALRRRGRGR